MIIYKTKRCPYGKKNADRPISLNYYQMYNLHIHVVAGVMFLKEC